MDCAFIRGAPRPEEVYTVTLEQLCEDERSARQARLIQDEVRLLLRVMYLMREEFGDDVQVALEEKERSVCAYLCFRGAGCMLIKEYPLKELL